MMRRWVQLVVMVGMMATTVHAGVVVLVDGRTIEGTVTLVAGGEGGVMVQPVGKAAVRANFAEVGKAVFDTSKEYDGVRWSRVQLGNGVRAGWAEIHGDNVTIRDASEGFRIARGGHRRDPSAMQPYACNFVFQKLQGDVIITANVQPSVAGPKTTRAGLMICEGLEGTGPFVMLSRTPDQSGTGMLARLRGEATMMAAGGVGEREGGGSWLRLIRKATPGKDQPEIEAFESANAVQWMKMGEIKRLGLNEEAGIYIGVAASGHWREGAMADFRGIRMTGLRVEAVIEGLSSVYWPRIYTLLADGTVLPVEVEGMKGVGGGGRRGEGGGGVGGGGGGVR